MRHSEIALGLCIWDIFSLLLIYYCFVSSGFRRCAWDSLLVGGHDDKNRDCSTRGTSAVEFGNLIVCCRIQKKNRFFLRVTHNDDALNRIERPKHNLCSPHQEDSFSNLATFPCCRLICRPEPVPRIVKRSAFLLKFDAPSERERERG